MKNYLSASVFSLFILLGFMTHAVSQETQPMPTETGYSTFADWCRNRENLEPEVKRTVNLVLERAGTFNCGRASQNLQDMTSLDLSTSQISDIRPLQGLSSLVELKLINNRITDVSPLQSLNNLSILDLSYNQINDITPLRTLENLRLLNLSYNQVSNVESLQSLKNLNELNLNNNQLTTIMALEPLDRLTYLYIRDNPIQDQTCPVRPKYICQF